MAYRGGGGRWRGGRGDQQQQQYGGGRGGAPAGGGRGGGRFVWPPPGASSSSAPRPAAPAPYTPAVAIYHNPNATGPHQGAYQHGVVFRGPAPPAVHVPSSTPVTIRAPSPTPATVRAPAPTPSPAAPPFQPARVSAPAPAPPTPAAAVAKELEQKLFVTETALAPPAAAAAAAIAATQQAEEEKAPEVDLAPVSKKGLAHPARPGAGTVGKKVMIRANHFLVNVADNNLFHYDVSINPESKSRAVNREVLSELIKLHGKTSLGGKLPAYDGRKSLYTAGSLPFESEEFSVTLVDPEKKDKERAEREYKITIRIAGRTDLYHLQQFLKGRQRDMPQETIQVLDVVLRESPSWNYVTVSRSFFSTTFGHRGDIGEGLECWRGYYQSLRPTQMGLSLNIDISATSFFKPVTVVQFVLEFLNLRDASRPLTDRDRVKIKKALRGVRVETNHQEDQIRRYKITGITPIPMSQLIFPVDERGTRMSVVQYFMQRYNYNLQYTSWPCLQSGSDARPVYLPMEACKIVEGQRYSKKLNDKQVTNILRATCQRPQQREQSIREMVLHNKYAEDKFAQEFGINVCSDLVSVPARVLPPPMLRYHDSGREKTCAPSVGQWNMINKKMINGGIIDNWACVSFSRMRPEEVHRFCCDLIQMCNMTGMSVNPRPLVDNRSASPNHIGNALRDVHMRTTEMLKGNEKQLQLLIVILPEVSGSYGKIKKVCETDLGIVSQCCLPRHAARPNKQYMENVALKINVKVGGRNTVLERAFVRNGIPFVSEVPTIIFGADVTHPPPGEDSASSIAAVVASMDWPEITKYRGLVSAQPHRQEIIEDLFSVTKDPQRGNVNGGMIRELLIAFRRKTGRRPERILFYRDGVSEGQFSHVLLHEMDAIRKACASLEEGYMPPVTFVVVQKRHHTRLFPEVHGRRDMTDKSGNILPGTVVDLMICHPTEFDFYLCSHAGIQGTSRPTHYHVLYDENHFTADALQSLTKNLCYTYARCTRAVSVGQIKKVCETDLGIESQCCLPRHAARLNKQYMENVALKINVKVGQPPSIEKAFTRFGVPSVKKVPTIIFGADVTHPPPGEDSASSIAAVVASMDWPEITKYRGLVAAQPHRQEIIEDLFSVTKDPQRGNVNGGMIRELLIAFRRKTGRRPERILFYRDGVSEGQLKHVRLHEMGAIRKACVEDGCIPQIIYIAIDKKHYSRPVPEVQENRANILLGSDSTKDSPVQPEHVHISINTPAGRFTVDIPSNGMCLDLKQAIESKIEAPIDHLTLKIGNSCIDYNQTLEFYGINENSLLRMDPKMRGGADRNQNDPEGSTRRASRKSRKRPRNDKSMPHKLMQAKRPRKRTRKNRRNNNTNAQPAMLPMPSRTSLANYASSPQIFRWITIRDPRDKDQSHDEEVIDTDGLILGKSLIEIFVNAVKQKLTWNRQLTIEDFYVIGGRVFCVLDPTDPLTELSFQADSYFLAQLIKTIFRTEQKQLLFMDDLISTLENASQSPIADCHVDENGVLWVRSAWFTYLITHYAFKSIIERGISTSNLMLFFNDLKSEEDKDQFVRDCNDTTCYAWNQSCGEAWTNYMFLPTVDFALEHHNKTYYGRGFKILQFVRDFNTHSPVVPWHLRDLSATIVLGIVICRIIKFLFREGWDIGKALGA